LLKLRRGSREKSTRKYFVNAGMSLWLLCLLMTALEFGFAVGYDRTDSFNMSNVSKKWFRKYAEPDEKILRFRANEGIVYRDDEAFPESIPDDTRHICFLGDSFTYGHGINRVSDRFSNQVRQQLNRDSEQPYVVSNVGKPGTDLFYAEAILENLFEEEIRVDTAVYTLCLNDIESFHPDFQTYYSGDWMKGSDFFLFRDTYFFNLLYFRIQQAQRPQVKNYYDFVREYYAGEPWERMKEKLSDINRLCEEHDCEFRVVIFPFLHNLGDDNPFSEVHEQIVAFCEEQGIPVIDLLSILEPHTQEGLVVSRFDAHPNERANELAAKAIRKWLLENKADHNQSDEDN
ncbi:MAG: SGNH/GDSL hydrolase family protein, partial [Planctomycetaceae bacterium]|nr:SGNH/GDSL hydrolase family protein [Planctomycetaceae bacterium]